MILFFICAVLAVVAGLGVITFRNPMHSAISMIATMISLAVIYLLQKAEFIAAIQISVYAGAVMVLIVFVIFLLDIRKETALTTAMFSKNKIIAAVVGGLVLVVLLLPVAGTITGRKGDMTDALLAKTGSIQYLADKLFTVYLLPFELASILLLVGLVGAVALAKKKL
jgi:NADH-quinone oxidoreductase subunit J